MNKTDISIILLGVACILNAAHSMLISRDKKELWQTVLYLDRRQSKLARDHSRILREKGVEDEELDD